MTKALKLKTIKSIHNHNEKYHKYKRIKKKRNKRKILMKKKFLQIESPYNTNDFLINNHSAPFFNYNDDSDDSLDIMLNSLSFISNNDNNFELDLFSIRERDSTNEKTIVFNEPLIHDIKS